MKFTMIKDIPDRVNEKATVQGWVTHNRPSGKLIFFEVRDGSGKIQCVVFRDDVGKETFEAIKKLPLETSVRVEGNVRVDKRSKLGYELGVTGIEVIHVPLEEFPISPKEHGVAFLLDNRHLWIRSERQTAILKIRASIIKAVRDFFDNEGFILFDTPIFTPSICEGTTNLFETEYFGGRAYLAQSGQLYAEAGALALGKVYTFGPTFRAEKSKTRRHLSEFWMVEPEAAFYDLDMIMDLAERFIVNVVQTILKKNKKELETIERDIEFLENVKAPFPKITYNEAIAILKDNNADVKWGDDFGGDEETIISNSFDRPLIINRYPASIKPFYMKNDEKEPEFALNCDMLAPEGYGEIIGGGQRENDYDLLLEKIRFHGLDENDFSWYLDLRKYGSVPHAGFGLGIERTVAWICGLKHVRETIPFPRMMDRSRP